MYNWLKSWFEIIIQQEKTIPLIKIPIMFVKPKIKEIINIYVRKVSWDTEMLMWLSSQRNTKFNLLKDSLQYLCLKHRNHPPVHQLWQTIQDTPIKTLEQLFMYYVQFRQIINVPQNETSIHACLNFELASIIPPSSLHSAVPTQRILSAIDIIQTKLAASPTAVQMCQELLNDRIGQVVPPDLNLILYFAHSLQAMLYPHIAMVPVEVMNALALLLTV